MRVGLGRKLSAKELMLLNCGVGEDSWEGARRSNQFILKEVSPGCSLEGLMLRLKLQYFGHLMRRDNSLEKTLMLGGIGGRRRRGWEDEMAGWHHWLDGREFEWTPGDGDGQGGLACCDSWGRKELDTTERLNWTETPGDSGGQGSLACAAHGVAKSQTWLSNWTTTKLNVLPVGKKTYLKGLDPLLFIFWNKQKKTS